MPVQDHCCVSALSVLGWSTPCHVTPMLTGTSNRPPDPLNMFGPLTMLDACHAPLMLVGTPTGPLTVLDTSCLIQRLLALLTDPKACLTPAQGPIADSTSPLDPPCHIPSTSVASCPLHHGVLSAIPAGTPCNPAMAAKSCRCLIRNMQVTFHQSLLNGIVTAITAHLLLGSWNKVI